MSSVADILSQALSLPFPQRVDLARKLIDSFDERDSPPLGASDEDVQARLASIESAEYESAAWRDALAEMRASLTQTQAGSE